MTGSPLSLLSFRMAARLRGRDKPGGRLRCRIAGGNPAAARLRSPASAARPQPGDDSTVAARTPKPDPRVDILEKTTPFKGYFQVRSEEHTSELQSLMRISYAVLCLKKENTRI